MFKSLLSNTVSKVEEGFVILLYSRKVSGKSVVSEVWSAASLSKTNSSKGVSSPL